MRTHRPDDVLPNETGSTRTKRPRAPRIVLTREDMTRLRAVVERSNHGPHADAADLLEAELDRAKVVPQEELPADVVSMRSRVVFEQVESGRQREAELVYPEEADVARSRISVLAPVGVALLGLRCGDSIEWPLPGGKVSTLRIVSVLYQPEAAGDLHL